ARPRPTPPRARRALRGRRPRLRRVDPRDPCRLRRHGRHRRRLLARHGPRRAHVRPRRRARRRPRPRGWHRRRGTRRREPRGPLRRARRRTPLGGGTRVVAQLLSLRWQVYLGTLRRSVWQTIGAVVAMLYAVSLGGLLAGAGLVGGLRSGLSAGG